jgi:hypothetical protein
LNLTFGEIKTLDSAPTSPLVTRIAALDDKVYLVCNADGSTVRNEPDRPVHQTLQDQIDARSIIKCGISLDGGEHFGEINFLYQANVAQHMPAEIVASNGKCFLAWGDGSSDATEPMVLFSKSKDDDSGFEDPIRLNLTSGDASASLGKPESGKGSTWDAQRRELFRRWYLVPRVKLAASGNNVYVFWTETTARLHTDAEYRLYFRASNDGGNTFGEKKHIGTMTISSKEFMRMFHINLTASGEVYMMWVQFTQVPGYMFSGSINPL